MGLLDRALNYRKKKKREADEVPATSVILDDGFELIEEESPEIVSRTTESVYDEPAGPLHPDTEIEDSGDLETVEVTLLDEETIQQPETFEVNLPDQPAHVIEQVPGTPEDDEYEHHDKLKEYDDRSNGDFMLLYEIEKEISKAETRDELYDVILFTLMGQIGTSSSSIMLQDPENTDNWIITQSSGVEIDNESLYFEPETGILSELISRKEIIDIEDYKDDRVLLNDYIKYISIDARLLIPLIFKDDVIGVAILGDKITTEEYSSDEKYLLMSVGEISAIAIKKLTHEEKINKENLDLKKSLEEISQIKNFRDSVKSETSIKNVSKAIIEQFQKLGIESYAIFVKHRDDERFYPEFTENEDRLSIKQSKFILKKNDDFVRYINKQEIPIKIDNHQKSDLIRSTFKESQIHKMSIFRVYPFLVGNNIQGFIIIFNIAPESNLPEIDKKLIMITEFLFYHIQNLLYMDSNQSSYIDNIEIIFKRIEDEILNSKNLGIPLSIVLLSIKNYRRYYNLYGHDSFKMLLEKFEELIKSRLSDNDFSLRYGRHKIIIVLPGKDKKYAVPLANTICQEISSQFNNRELQLLMTSLTAEYPRDGEDLYSLMDKIDL